MSRTRTSTTLIALLAGLLGAFALALPAAAQTTTATTTAAAQTATQATTSTAAQTENRVTVLSAVPASVDDFTFDAFDADYTLTRDDDGTSHLRVVETLVAVFPEFDQNRGIRRMIPDTYNGQPLHAHLVSITDENGTPRASEIEDVDGAFSVVSRADGYVHGQQTYVITYTLENVTWDFPDTGLEFYWDVNGVDWSQHFGSVTARLHVGADLAASLTGSMSCYQGYQGATDACDSITQQADAGGGTVITAEAGALEPNQTLSMAVGFESGAFTPFDTSYLATPLGWLQAVAGLGALGAGALAIRARRKPLADEPGRPTIIAEYEPPRVVDALESSVLLGRPNKGIPAEVLEQAVVGSLRIIEGPRTWMGKAKLTAELVDPSRADGDGRMLLQGLFPSGRPGEQYEFGRQDTRLSSVAQRILSAAGRELVTRGLRRPVPAGTRAWPIALGVGAGVLAFLLGIAIIDGGSAALWPVIVIVLCAVVLIVVFGLVGRRPLTALGAETRDHLKGLEQFIAWAEADRIRMLQSPSGAERVAIDVNDPRQKLALYEKLLPYAVVFGQEKEWSSQLAILYTAVGATGPYWYYGRGAFDASSFSAGIGSLSASASSASSPSGGSSGGGSVGGGGGGGGGGGV